MHITTKGGSSTQKKYATSMAEFCGEKLLGTRLFPKVSVEIQFVKNLLKKEEIYGDAEWLDFERRPKEFTIRVDGSQPLRRMLETVAHEMVHVKQFARGELYENSANKHRWQGTWLNKDPEYWDAPWEIEAHGREIGLFVQWAEKNKLGHLKWTQSSK